MKIALATIQTPFIYGGAEYLIHGLHGALTLDGHNVERISMPFRFAPPEQVKRSMDIWESEDLTLLNGYQADLVICLQFPTYYAKHSKKVLWLLHQYRVVYDLWETPFALDFRKDSSAAPLRKAILEKDKSRLEECSPRFTIAKNVSTRLQHYNGVSSIPLYHPPFMAERFFCKPAESYVFVPSRLEDAKRQDLLIRAMQHTKTSLTAVICGEGGQKLRLERLAEELGVEDRVVFIGRASEEEKLGLFAHCLCVFFGPFDEDYGYVTLEAMLASKPVVTCVDSGGPLEFVVHEQTGLIVLPQPEAIAEALDILNGNRNQATTLGANGRERYRDLNISWDSVVNTLTATKDSMALKSVESTLHRQTPR